jgi:hypothetical protein
LRPHPSFLPCSRRKVSPIMVNVPDITR